MVAPALTPLSPEPSGLSQLLPGDELSVRDSDDNFQGSGRARAGVGRGRGANSSVLGRSRVPVWDSKEGEGLRRSAEGKIVDGSGRRGMSRVSREPVCEVLVGVMGGSGMLPSDGVRWCPVTVCARGLIALSDGVRRCPRFTAMEAET